MTKVNMSHGNQENHYYIIGSAICTIFCVVAWIFAGPIMLKIAMRGDMGIRTFGIAGLMVAFISILGFGYSWSVYCLGGRLGNLPYQITVMSVGMVVWMTPIWYICHRIGAFVPITQFVSG